MMSSLEYTQLIVKPLDKLCGLESSPTTELLVSPNQVSLFLIFSSMNDDNNSTSILRLLGELKVKICTCACHVVTFINENHITSNGIYSMSNIHSSYFL